MQVRTPPSKSGGGKPAEKWYWTGALAVSPMARYHGVMASQVLRTPYKPAVEGASLFRLALN